MEVLARFLDDLNTNPDAFAAFMAGVVFLIALARFKRAPPPPPPPSLSPPGPQRWWETARRLTRSGERGLIRFAPPSRANTSFLSFWIFRLLYAATAIVVFLLVYHVPAFGQLVLNVLGAAGGSQVEDALGRYRELGPLALAFLIAGFAPPPVRGIEESVRRFFYDHALIDARQRCETARLKEAPFRGEDLFDGGMRIVNGARERVWEKLEAEGFDRADLAYNPRKPTARSLWMKASLLMVHMRHWQAQHKYMKAFNSLMERDGTTRSVAVVETDYERLKDKARACFEAQRLDPGGGEPDICQEFRQDCRELLRSIYSLLSRVSLATHLGDGERIRCMGQIGFALKPAAEGPMPDENELAALAVLLALVLWAPLAWVFGDPWRPFVIYVITFATVMSPILIAHRYPDFAVRRGAYAPALAFPLAAGAAAAAVHVGLAFGLMLDGDLGQRAAAYGERSWEWTVWVAAMAMLIAARMRAGAYPAPGELEAGPRWRAYGDLRDAAILALALGAVAWAFFLPAAVSAAAEEGLRAWSRVLLPPVVAFAIGFVVPTWYRAKMKRKTQERVGAPAMPAPA